MEIPYTVTPRPDTGLANPKLGIWLFIASEVMLFGGLFAGYIFMRLGAEPWMWPHGWLNVPVGTFNTFVLIASSVTVILSWEALKMRNFKAFRTWLAITWICGLLFLAVKLGWASLPRPLPCTPRWPTRPNPWLQLPLLGYTLGRTIPVRWLRLDTSINAQSTGIAVLVSTRQHEISELFRDWAPVTRHQSFCKAATRRALPALLLGSRSGQGPRARARRLRHSTGFTSWPRQPS